MKIKSLVAGIVTALSMASVAHAVTTTVNGGPIHFEGEVVNAACAVDVGSIGQKVPMGQVKTTTLATAGNTSSAVGFNIQLNDCDTIVSTQASVAFSGTAVSSTYKTALALQGSVAGNATNVGIQILDRTGTALALDGATFSAATTLSDGNVVVPFQARYIATGVATAGTANADATFKVQYQ
ncbi:MULTISPECIES: type 1 fimbrial major subunit FimA [unclassified Serratia (in: enterobacteria)]|uniref:type 1 fimbrial major subunit FimA n=1 Tax=unclassified Serratia (in: enterobacteria) TaxID=2647522 RepID=UPI00050487E3|nr:MULTISPECIES: type 1 fimbrial major subunit FimA [unclassified Serratia (in: enterobacteria)]KFK91669.1 type-1 fimbrial protein subunit A [Serratia sp. Ag2]KFK95652.1 type-1 fimbrial protein subunit A [Serratia sp. Ag1]